MENRSIEIHDSAIDQIILEGSVGVLRFPKVYGTQEAVIRVANAQIEGAFSRTLNLLL